MHSGTREKRALRDHPCRPVIDRSNVIEYLGHWGAHHRVHCPHEVWGIVTVLAAPCWGLSELQREMATLISSFLASFRLGAGFQ
jgi:hypothetical protein